MPNITKVSTVILSGVLLLVELSLLNACGDGPTGSGTMSEPPIYFNAGTLLRPSYRYFPGSCRIDTLDLPFDSERTLAVSADGDVLFLASGNGVGVVDADSLTVIDFLPYEASTSGVAASSDGRYVAIAGDGFHLLRTSDYSVAFADTGQMSAVVFARGNRTVYCIGGYEPGSVGPYIYQVRILDSGMVAVRLRPQWNGVPWRIVPTPSQDKWIMFLKRGLFDYLFGVYDVATDSVEFEQAVSPGAGDIVISPDGRYAFFTNPGTPMPGPAPRSSISVYNIRGGRMETAIETGEFSSVSPGYFPIGSLAITPDGRWLVGLRGPFGGEAVIIRLADLSVRNGLNLTANLLGEVACQTGK